MEMMLEQQKPNQKLNLSTEEELVRFLEKERSQEPAAGNNNKMDYYY